ncbi:DNA polymerase III subunit chi [Metapseudomonas otitidis]|uniref:DNA polymerase III subunit chi n=1 Tax=Metapseudomonas otitidis TaxID=319939 RepID=UPI002097923A|nr:DNA polymerase III subunit chi [Pseudomonas otitidis]MCO7555499.1 DNA polymerase III subunit chi [Pseudomonas otitidis]
MDNPSQPPRPAHLLDDLESIRALLDEHTSSEPPLLTESVDPASIPLLSEIVEPPPFSLSPAPAPQATQPAAPAAPRPAPAPTPAPVKAAAPVPPVAPAPTAPSTAQPSVRAGVEAATQTQLDRLDGELRAAAQLILQDVIDDFVPQIEAELKRRLNARLARLLPQLPRRS